MSAFTTNESNTTDVVLSPTTLASLTPYRVEDGVMQEGIARIRAIPSFINDIDIWYQMFIFTAVKGFSGILALDNAKKVIWRYTKLAFLKKNRGEIIFY